MFELRSQSRQLVHLRVLHRLQNSNRGRWVEFSHWLILTEGFDSAIQHTLFNTFFTQMNTLYLEIRTSFGESKEVLVDDPDQMFHLADLLEGMSVDCAEFYSKSLLQGITNKLPSSNHGSKLIFVTSC